MEHKGLFFETSTKSFTFSRESWTTDRKPVNTGQKFKFDIRLSLKINARLYLEAAHQNTQHIDLASTINAPAKLPNNRFNFAIFDKGNTKQYFVESVGIRYPKILV